MIRDKTLHHGNIVEAATAEFMEYGFQDASMRRIAAAAGMSASGMYKHFASKEEMFSALVEPTCHGLMDLYRKRVDNLSSLIEKGVPSVWESGQDAKFVIAYIYDHLDVFRLIICKSQGTRYETFLYDIAVLEEQVTLSFMEMLKKQGVQIREFSRKEFHLLTMTNVNAVFQTVENDFTHEEAMHYAETLDRFFAKAWKEFFGY